MPSAELKSRIPGKGRVRIYLKGKYKYSVDAGDFEQMTQDAMKRIDTTAFTLDHVKRLSDDRAFARQSFDKGNLFRRFDFANCQASIAIQRRD